MNKQNSGFTLVELSIVLVIIGLLIGGILIGQTLIEASKLTTTIRIITQFDAAANSFYAKYRALPGDARAFGGDGDGKIESMYCVTGYIGDLTWVNTGYCHTAFNGEIGSYWNNLSMSGLKADNGTNYANHFASGSVLINSGSAQNVPKVPLGDKTVVVAFTQLNTTQGDPAAGTWGKPFYQLLGVESVIAVNGGDTMSPSYTPTQAMGLDGKFDDGLPMAGKVQNSQFGGISNLGDTGDNSPPCLGSATMYNLADNRNICSSKVMMDVTIK